MGRTSTEARTDTDRGSGRLTQARGYLGGVPAERYREMRIYVASSWRNRDQPTVVQALRDVGHHVYDFRHPAPGDDGFRWAEIDPAWETWTPAQYRAALTHPLAQVGFAQDRLALQMADATVLVLPCGRSAHLELGYAAGLGQRTAVLMLEPSEAELMYLLCDRVCLNLDELLVWLQEREKERRC
jgi:hypothetical protein